MKKLLMLLCVAFTMVVNGYSQEVRGVETRLAEYEGDEYTQGNNTYTTYYGFELTNKNSIKVSVSVEIYMRRDDDGTSDELTRVNAKEDKLITTKEVVLAPGEKYIVKWYQLKKYNYYYKPYGSYRSGTYYLDNGKLFASYFYVKYKAYKVL